MSDLVWFDQPEKQLQYALLQQQAKKLKKKKKIKKQNTENEFRGVRATPLNMVVRDLPIQP